MQAQVDKSKQQIRELERQVQEEKRKQQIQKLEARVAAEQTQHHALATKLQAQERQKRTALEQTLEQAMERTRQQEQELTRLVTETTKPRVGASAGARRPIFVKKRHENGHGHASDKENTTPSQPTEIKDMSLSCAKCRRTWVWTPGSQAFYKREDKGTPKYCPGCRN